jgi:hypothetical protein
MSNLRIALYTPRKRRKKGQTSTTTSYVEVGTAQELSAKLVALGAKRVGLLRRDRAGETKEEGEMFAPSALTAKHLTWLTAEPKEFEIRGLFYDDAAP